MALSSRGLLIALVALSLVVGGGEAALFSAGRTVGASFQTTWSLVFLLLLVTWVNLDSRERKNIYRPFEFGFLMLVFLLPYLP